MQAIIRRQNLPAIILPLLAAAAITVTGILFGQSAIRILPLYISVIIALLQSKVSRTAYLLGGLNSILYAVVYFSMKLYASAAYALFFSCTIQLATWILWKRRASGKATVFRAMKNWQRLLVVLGFAAALVLCTTLLKSTDSGYPLLDTAVSLIGILISFLTMFAFIEYAPLMIVSQLLSMTLYALMLRENPAQITYLIFAVYGFLCQIRAFKNVTKLYAQQNNDRKETHA